MQFTKFVSLIAVLTLILGAVPASGWARERPKVQIVFQLDEPQWQGKIVSEGRTVAELNEELATNLAKTFGSRIGFVDFVTEPAPLQLKVSLLRHPVNPGTDFIPTDFKLQFLGLPPGEGLPEMLLLFRESFEYVESVTYQGLVDETSRRMETRLATGTHLAQIVKDLLSHVSLASEVQVVQVGGLVLAVIPWSSDEINVAKGSEFTIKTPIPGLGLPRDHFTSVLGSVTEQLRDSLSSPYDRGLIVIDHPPPAGSAPTLGEIQIPIPNTPVPIIGLHVTLYIPLPAVNQPHPPSGFNDE